MWIEKRGGKWLVRERRDGKKRTVYTTPEEHDARHFSRMGKPFPMSHYEAMDRLSQSMGELRSARNKSPKLSTYAFEVIDNDPNIGETSRTAYRNTISNHLVGCKIDVFIKNIDAPLLRAFWVGLTPKKVYAANGNGMKSSVYRVLNKVLTQAVRDRNIDVNPLVLANIKRPSKKRAVEVEPLTIDQVEELAAACLNERDRLMILVGGYCGLRGGEVGGLRVKDIDTKACAFNIRQAVKGSGANKHLGLPKGDKTRKIVVPCSIAREVAKFARKNAASDGRIFTTPGDGMVGARQTTKASQAAAKQIGFRPVNFHMLRHTTASLLVAEGASVKDVQQYLGIATAAILLDTYSHAFEGTDQRLADSLERRRGDYRKRLKQL